MKTGANSTHGVWAGSGASGRKARREVERRVKRKAKRKLSSPTGRETFTRDSLLSKPDDGFWKDHG